MDATTVSLKAEVAWWFVIASQPCARHPSAANGSSTITLR